MIEEEALAPLQFEIKTDTHVATFIADPEPLYAIVHAEIQKQMHYEVNPDSPQDVRMKAQLMRTTVKGVLLAAGGLVLDMMYGSKDHPRPGKKDDLIEWYACEFAKFAIVMATRGKLSLELRGGETFVQERPIIIDAIRTIATSEPVGQNRTDAGNGTETSGSTSAPATPDRRGSEPAPV